MASRCTFPNFDFSLLLGFKLPMISIPFPKLPTMPNLNFFCPLD